MASPEPTPFGKYELLRRIGAGGMGEIFLARRHGAPPGDVVVVKKILPHLSEDKGFVGRFVDEGKVVVRLNHPNIAQVFEMGEFDSQYFMAMEYVEGKTLAKVESRLRELNYSFPVDLALWVVAQLCEGLEYAHHRADADGKPLQVVHRDVSPSNAMLTYEGQLKIIDFGAALSTLKEEMTAPRVVIGNLSYMAPEHARKQHVDARADVFSAGVVLWELLTWQLISADGDPIERWRRAARPSFQKPSAFRADLPPVLDDITMRALAADARDRYPDAASFRDVLLALLREISPSCDGRKLAAFMRSLFLAECEAERQIVAEAAGTSGLALAASGPVTAPVTDPFLASMERSDPGIRRHSFATTLPGAPALTNPGELLSDPAVRATAPGRPAIDVEALESLGAEPTATRPAPVLPQGTVDDPEPTESRPALGQGEEFTASTKSEPRRPPGRSIERTPTRMRKPLPSFVWVGVGVGLGAVLVAVVFALIH